MSHLLDASAKGVYAISATPFTDAGEIDWASVDSLIDFYLQCGVSGLTILGMMGEAQKLSEAESPSSRAVACGASMAACRSLSVCRTRARPTWSSSARTAMDAGACGVMVAPLTGLKTEVCDRRLFRRCDRAAWRPNSGRLPGLPAVDASRHLRAGLPQDRRRACERGDVQARGLPRPQKALAIAQGLRWNGAAHYQHSGRERRIIRSAGAAPRRGRGHDRLCLSRDAGVRLLACSRPDRASKPRICSTSTCRWCAMSSSPGSALPCARRFCAGAAQSDRLRCAHRVRSSTPMMSRSSTACWLVCRRV